MRCVFYGGVGIAGPIEIVGENLGEGHLGRTVRRPSMAVCEIGSSFDGRGGGGCLLHRQRIQQLALQDGSPVAGASNLRNDASSQDVGKVGVGKGGTEARYRFDV